MSNMINFGNGLGKKYSGNPTGNTKTEAEKKVASSDREALRKAGQLKRHAREEREAKRAQKVVEPQTQLDNFEKDPTKDIAVGAVLDKAKAKTNALAREYALPEPNNPEALKHDRLHCATCDRTLDDPNAHKSAGLEGLFDDAEVRIMCCWCFGRMSHDKIKSTMYSGKEATKEIRLAIYNPAESTKAEIEEMTDIRRIALKSKIKKYNDRVKFVGNIKHDYLQEGDDFENIIRNQARTRYTACTL